MTVWPDGNKAKPDISSHYGPRPGVLSGFHNGTDFINFTKIRSVESGTVKYAGWNDLMGWIVYTSHAGDSFRSRSCHMRYTPNVKYNQRISEGQYLDDMGNTGSQSAGKHLHFDIYLPSPNGWYRTDPEPFLASRIGILAGTGSTPLPTPKTEDNDMLFVRSENTGHWYVIYETSVTKIDTTDHAHAVAYSEALDRRSVEMGSKLIQQLMADAEARAKATFGPTDQRVQELQAKINEFIEDEENAPEPLTIEQVRAELEIALARLVDEGASTGMTIDQIAQAVSDGLEGAEVSIKPGSIQAIADGVLDKQAERLKD